MKKIVLLCSVVFAFACSNENETLRNGNSVIENSTFTERPLPPIENEIDEMFYQYVTSDIFLEVQELMTAFNNDLNFEGSTDQIDTSAKLFLWITNNLERTNFSSIEDAENRWDHLAVRRGIEMELFPEVYQFFIDSSTEEFTEVISKWLPNQTIPTGSGCEDNFKSCNDKASADYKANMEWALTNEGSEKQKEINCADDKHTEDTKACKRAFDACNGN